MISCFTGLGLQCIKETTSYFLTTYWKLADYYYEIMLG